MGGSRGHRAPSAASLSCGAGGLACGFAKAGLRAAAGAGTDGSRGYAFEAGTRSMLACKPVEDAAARASWLASAGRARAASASCSDVHCAGRFSATTGTAPPTPGGSCLARSPDSCPGHSHTLSRQKTSPSPTRLCPHVAFGKFARRLRGKRHRAWHGAVKCPCYGVPLPPGPAKACAARARTRRHRHDRRAAFRSPLRRARRRRRSRDHAGRMPASPRGSPSQGARAVRAPLGARVAGPAGGRLEEVPGRSAGTPVPPERAGKIARQRVRPDVAEPAVARGGRAGRNARDRAARPSRSGQGPVAQEGGAGPDAPARLQARGRKDRHARRSGGKARRGRRARRPREGNRPGIKRHSAGEQDGGV